MRHDQSVAAQYLAGKVPAQAPIVRIARLRQSLRARLIEAADWVGRRMEKRRSRLALLEMTDEQLKDIGLSRGEAYSELNRPLWD
ncbi:DUF1127 domain-containing protein [Mesorhizobium sp. M00.F.Ca.ET.186.01.1.1]|nr:DUF1127 domain-containing protein [bacterium M00.F.Ca.ET.205.01.1.1]TGU55630.1 DUF1127 domain-containing protein [bacterium M00.F.Ca.ET.152.01.1.1]TGV40093.1 DUF1127 domain-containing protein [Mesorhizobium sp. M00.F.Ca.ET.186.01.1.1]TGZ45078.1 DUF1127 domain-containing protein [bacterium M00.F.Ca.ET.162.01.1.1]